MVKKLTEQDLVAISVSATPSVPATNQTSLSTPAVKSSDLSAIIFDEDSVPIELIEYLLFENIGGQELLNISRNDIINGQSISYNLIKNLASLQQQFNSTNIISLDGTSDKYFSGFSIKIEDKTPTSGNGANGEFVYIDPITGDLVVEAVNLQPDERIEIEIIQNGTIYDTELG